MSIGRCTLHVRTVEAGGQRSAIQALRARRQMYPRGDSALRGGGRVRATIGRLSVGLMYSRTYGPDLVTPIGRRLAPRLEN